MFDHKIVLKTLKMFLLYNNKKQTFRILQYYYV